MMQAPPSAIARQWALETKINMLAANADGTAVAAALGDGRILRWRLDDSVQEPLAAQAHDGVSLCLAALGDGFVSGGDDGRVVVLAGEEPPREVARQPGRWIDQVAGSSDGAMLAYAFGKSVQVVTADGAPQGLARPHPTSLGGLAFSPNGKRLAVSHNNGVTLWWTAAASQTPVSLPWKGSHLLVSWSPDGKTVMTAMQENALHGWRLSDMNEMRMQGYAGKICSMEWGQKGKWLVTSGAPQAICWPFSGGGPWGKAPTALGSHQGALTRAVTPHPKDALVAIGYEDGMIELAPFDGRPGVMIHPPVAERGHGVAGLAWNAAGDCLFAASADGYVMLFTLNSVSNAVAV